MADYTRTLSTSIAFTHLAGHYVHVLPAYATINFVDGYLRTRLNIGAWEIADQDDREAALIQATEIMERLNFSGDKADEDQELFFPRDEDTGIPVAIQKACAEICLALLDGVDPEIEYQNLVMTSQGYGEARSSYDRKQHQPHIVHGVPSSVAWRFMVPYLRDPHAIKLDRV
jgi:hypothetical protein